MTSVYTKLHCKNTGKQNNIKVERNSDKSRIGRAKITW